MRNDKDSYLIAIGDFVDGFKFFGPFDSADEAIDWVLAQDAVDWSLAELLAPQSAEPDLAGPPSTLLSRSFPELSLPAVA